MPIYQIILVIAVVILVLSLLLYGMCPSVYPLQLLLNRVLFL